MNEREDKNSGPASPGASRLNFREYRTVDKSTWGDGQWQDEPDKIQWIDEATGFDCLIVRNSGGALCGYVGLPEGHPFHAVDYDEVHRRDDDVQAHGGLTFAGFCSDNSREAWDRWRARKAAWEAEALKYPKGDAARRLREWAGTFEDYEAWLTRSQSVGICHIPAPGRPDKVWWLGFDCAHSGDLCPAHAARDSFFRDYRDSYKSVRYVEREVQNLARQLAKAEGRTA